MPARNPLVPKTWPHNLKIMQRWGVIALLLTGVWLRWASLEPMMTMVHYDEAYNALDAVNVLHNPQITLFFPGNFGREGGFVYWLLPFVGILNGNPLAVRFAATIVGILTLAATYKLAWELLGSQGAVWSLGALTVLYWHVHLSHLALRSNLFVLVGTLSAAWLLQASRTHRLAHWSKAGIATGLLAYTYFASFFWMGYAAFCLLAQAVGDTKRRKGARFSALSMTVFALPMGVFILKHPEYFFSRPQTVARLSPADILHNLQLWGNAWFIAGDPNATFNLPGRPILDLYTGVLWSIGLIGLLFLVRRKWHAAWLIGWAILGCAPSLMTNQAPHFLRAAGLTIPTAIIIGTGALAVTKGVHRWVKAPATVVLPLVLLALAGKATYTDFHQQWINHPETFRLMEQPLNQAVDFIRHTVSPDAHVYFSPFSPEHPVIGFRSPDLAPRSISAFDSHQCLVVSDANGVYVSLTTYEPGFYNNLSQWLDTTILYEDPGIDGGAPRYTIFQTEPYPNDRHTGYTEATFGNLLQVRTMRAISTTVQAGTALPIILGITAQQIPEQPVSLFVHLYGDPTPYEGGRLWGQADSQICAAYPTNLWHTDETIVQAFTLTLPDDIPADTYTVAIGVYLFPDGDRLSITIPDLPQAQYYTLGKITVQ